MADITEQRINIQEEEVSYRAAVSEATNFRMGASVNFINKRQYDTKAFFLNGPYDVTPAPDTDLDGLYIVPFDLEIIGASMFNIVSGSAGTTELDIKRRTSSGGAGASIFSTTPKITSSAPDASYVGVIESTSLGGGTGQTEPVLSVTQVDQGDALSIDALQKQTGAQNAGLILYIRPR